MKTFVAAALIAALAIPAAGVIGQALPQAAAPERSETERQLAAITDEASLLRTAGEYEAAKDWRNAAYAWHRLTAIRPNNPGYKFNLAANLAQAEDMSGAYDVLLGLQRTGVAYDLESEARFANIHGTEVWELLAKLNTEALATSFGEGRVAFELPAADLLLESIAHDANSNRFLFGSARDGVIYRRGSNGRLSPWARPQGESWWSIFDIKVDAARKHVWATTAAVPHFKGFKAEMAGRSALLKLDLDDGKLLAAYPAPNDGLPHILNGIALSSEGTVIVAEGMRGQLFKLDGDALQPLMAEPRLNALRGLSFSRDNKILYFADYEMGLFGLDLTNRVAFDVRRPDNVILYGIEGLYGYEGQLVAIQNGVRPQRVMRLKLSADGRAIEQAVPLESANPAFATPTLGTLVGSQLHYIANSQRDYYDGYGLLKRTRPLPPVKVFRTDARFNWDFQPPRFPGTLTPVPPKQDGG